MKEKISIFVAHPDDEIIFFAPFFNKETDNLFNQNIFNRELICLTCKSNKIRRSEFIKITNHIKCSPIHFDLPIVRGLPILHFKENYKLIYPIIKNKTNICVTHSLYGDDHFHPQHSIISLVCLFSRINLRIPMIVPKSQKNLIYVLFSAFTVRTNFKSIKSILFIPIKIILIFLDYILFNKKYQLVADNEILFEAKRIYKSQSLEYHSYKINKYSFGEIRKIWKIIFFIN